jgi:FkbM family methyltransferase
MSDFSNEIEFEIVRDIVNKESVTLDLGANVGLFTKVLAKNSKKVYAIEPEPFNFKQLKKNMKSFHNVTLFNVAVSNVTGWSDLFLSHCNSGMHRLYPSIHCYWDKRVNVRTIRVDDLIYDENIDFIKMDIEGFEYFAIDGMRKLLRRSKPVIMSEFHPDSIRESGANPRDIFTMMRILDYNYPIICLTGEIIHTYERLEEVTNDPKGGVNILWTI